ncbi:MAG: pyridoxamine 5'-phosphate oxidase family protein [Actinomycetota bacterium]
MLDPETTAFLETGCALIVGTVGPDGAPHAGRAWGVEVLDHGPTPRVRILLDVDDERTVAHAAAGGRIAITATSVRTLTSMQLKGRSLGLDDAEDDGPRMHRYIEQFFTDIVETDGTDRAVLDTFRPFGSVACLVQVEERYEQTPGPGAGARVR